MARQMKDSGVEWIGEIPETWDLVQLKRFVTVNNGREIEVEVDDTAEGAIGVYGSGGVFKYTDRYMHDGVAVMFGRKGTLGKPLYVDKKFWVVDTMYYLTYTEALHPKYNYYQLMVFDWNPHITQTALPSVVASQIVAKNFPIPDIKEQRRIAAFLDHRCAEIDAVMERTRATIEEYKKLKQAVITEAVTKGVRGERKMKDSGIEWIGEIPEGWDIVKLKYFLSDDKVNLRVGPFGSALAGSDFVEEGEWVYNQRVVLDDNFISNDTFVSASKYAELVGFEVIPDDVLITTRGSIGKVAIVPQDAPRGILHPCIIKFRVNQDMIPHSILKHVFNDTDFVLRQIKEMSNSTTIDVLYSYSLRNVLLPLIPMCEQPEVAAYLDEKCAALDTLIAKKTALLTELETYKKSLIYEYVTGKTEVQ